MIMWYGWFLVGVGMWCCINILIVIVVGGIVWWIDVLIVWFMLDMGNVSNRLCGWDIFKFFKWLVVLGLIFFSVVRFLNSGNRILGCVFMVWLD